MRSYHKNDKDRNPTAVSQYLKFRLISFITSKEDNVITSNIALDVPIIAHKARENK